MRRESVRERLPGYLDRELRAVGPVDVHLASCAELDVYRRLHTALSKMATRPEPSDELLPELLRRLPSPPVGGLAGPRSRYALASLGGAAVGATAVAIVWWRLARRAQAVPASAAV